MTHAAPPTPITLTLLSAPTDDARLLISELDAVLHADSPPENRHGYPIDRLFQPHILFFIAYLDQSPVGCGGVAFTDLPANSPLSFSRPACGARLGSPEPELTPAPHRLAEIKRMYVRPAARGRGVAQSLLARLESESRFRNASRLVLETGDNRDAALALYTKYGFSRCPAFPPYTTFPPHTIAHSVFMQKPLT